MKATTPITQPTAAQIDRCAYLLALEAENKPWMKELNGERGLKATMQAYGESQSAEKAVRLDGDDYYLDLTARAMKREITDKPKAFAALRKALGIVALIQALTLTFKLLKEAGISDEDQAKWITEEQTGYRTITGGLMKLPVAKTVA